MLTVRFCWVCGKGGEGWGCPATIFLWTKSIYLILIVHINIFISKTLTSGLNFQHDGEYTYKPNGNSTIKFSVYNCELQCREPCFLQHWYVKYAALIFTWDMINFQYIQQNASTEYWHDPPTWPSGEMLGFFSLLFDRASTREKVHRFLYMYSFDTPYIQCHAAHFQLSLCKYQCFVTLV